MNQFPSFYFYINVNSYLGPVPHSGEHLLSKWRQLFLGTMSVSLSHPYSLPTSLIIEFRSPNILAFNFASTLVEATVFLVAFMCIATLLLYWFFRSTSSYLALGRLEGLRQQSPHGRSWGLLIVTFLLTFIYLPLSTLAVHVLVWSDDLWVVPNPYVNATSSSPVVPPLGPSDEYRDPLDFCYTTTMKRDDVNYAPILVILAVIVFASVSVSYCGRPLTINLTMSLVDCVVPTSPAPSHSQVGTCS